MENHSQKNSINPNIESHDLNKKNIDSNVMRNISLNDPQVSKTKGAPKRMKCRIEKKSKKSTSKKALKTVKLSHEEVGCSSQKMGDDNILKFLSNPHFQHLDQ
ncbi:hypothetical protein F8388_012745 [Cannabis sativa]|nr:hypothetical protein F8388_012745 [Cannabis sativa]